MVGNTVLFYIVLMAMHTNIKRQLKQGLPSALKRGGFPALKKDIMTEQQLYNQLNISIRCSLHEQHRAYLRCPVCPDYNKCEQLTKQQRLELESSPFFEINYITWGNPERSKMYIALMKDGFLRQITEFDPKNTNTEDFKDIQEVFLVTKRFKRQTIWSSVPVKPEITTEGKPKKKLDK